MSEETSNVNDIRRWLSSISERQSALEKQITNLYKLSRPARTGTRLLPVELREMKLEVTSDGDLIILAGFYEKNGWIVWESIPFSDFSQNLTRFDDLERLVVDRVEQKGGTL